MKTYERKGFWWFEAYYTLGTEQKRLQRTTNVKIDASSASKRKESKALADEVAAKKFAKFLADLPTQPQTAADRKDPYKVSLQDCFDSLLAKRRAEKKATGTAKTTREQKIACCRALSWLLKRPMTEDEATPKRRFKNQEKEKIDPVPVAEITQELLVRFVNARRASGIGDGTLNVNLRYINQALASAGFPRVEAPDVPIPEGRRRTISMEDVDRLIAICWPKWRDHLRLWRHMGIRLNEICYVLPEHVHLDENYVEVHGTKTDGSNRDVPFTPDAKAIFEQRMKDPKPGKPLFERWSSYWNSLQGYAKKLGLGHKLSATDFRRSFCTDLLMAGEQNTKVAALMGHKTTLMIDKHYGKLDRQKGGLTSTVMKLRSFGAPGAVPPTEPEAPSAIETPLEDVEPEAAE